MISSEHTSRPPRELEALRDRLGAGNRFLWGARSEVRLSELGSGTRFGGRLVELYGRSVLLSTDDQLAAAVAMIELDGVVRRMVVCPPDLARDHRAVLIGKAEVDAIVSDREETGDGLDCALCVKVGSEIVPSATLQGGERLPTEWVLLTSGTTGVPKMIAHTLTGLTGAIKKGQHDGPDVVWGTFYDIRRYGGLQIFLRFILGTGSMVLSDAHETPTAHLERLAARSVTHLTGTPSHWRKALMSSSANVIRPRYARLSGEIADQAILNTLQSFYPEAAVGHAFASTEAGVAFEVTDGLAGFPARYVGGVGEVDVEIEDHSLRIRSPRTATRYVGEDGETLKNAGGFVDTGDIVERRGDRYHFLGRSSGLINVGGLKVYPEEIEAVLNRHPIVRMSRVRSRRSPITGSLVVADVVLKEHNAGGSVLEDEENALRGEILEFCRRELDRHKVPARLTFVSTLGVASTGKMVRQNA